MHEALLEADVFGIAETTIGVERRRVIGADVEHDLVARLQEFRGDRTGDRRRKATSTIVDVGQDVADHGEPRTRTDHVRPSRSNEAAVDPEPDEVKDRPGGLTGRELQGLRLVMRGLTNREIADELVITEATVQRHLANMYAKAGARNRAELIRWAHAHGVCEEDED